MTRPEEVWKIEPAPARSASPQRDHQSGRRDAIESATQPLLTVTTPAYPAAVSECAVTSSAAMDVTPSTRDSSTSQHRDNENGSDVEERMDRSSERCSEPTSGTTTAAAVEDALSPAAVNALPSVPERSASEREDHQTRCHEERRCVRESDRQYDDAPHATTSEESVLGRSEPTSVVEQPCGRQERGDEASTLATTAAACDDTCAASEENILAAADEPPCIRQREDEVMASPTEVSMFPSDPVTSASQCQPADHEGPRRHSADELQIADKDCHDEFHLSGMAWLDKCCDFGWRQDMHKVAFGKPLQQDMESALPAVTNTERKCANDFKREAAAEDQERQQLKERLAASWPTAPAPVLRPHETFRDGNRLAIMRLHSTQIRINSCIRRAATGEDEVVLSPAEVSTLPSGPVKSASKPVDPEDQHRCSPSELQCEPRNLRNNDASPADKNLIERKCAADFIHEAAADNESFQQKRLKASWLIVPANTAQAGETLIRRHSRINCCIRRQRRATEPGLINGHTVPDWRRKAELISAFPRRTNEMRLEEGFGPPPDRLPISIALTAKTTMRPESYYSFRVSERPTNQPDSSAQAAT